jgi:hypothetical protein
MAFAEASTDSPTTRDEDERIANKEATLGIGPVTPPRAMQYNGRSVEVWLVYCA